MPSGTVTPAASGGSSPVQIATLNVSAAQIIAAVDLEIVAAAANTIHVPLQAVAWFDAGASQFTGGQADNALVLACGPSGDFWLGNNAMNSSITAAADQVIVFGALPAGFNFEGDVTDAATEFVNQALMLGFRFGTSYAAGNGTLRVSVAYFDLSTA